MKHVSGKEEVIFNKYFAYILCEDYERQQKKRNLIKKKWWKRLEMKQLRRYCLRVAITMRSKQQNHLSYSQFWLNFCFNFLPLYHFLSPSPFSLCCHDQTAVHCICSCVPQKILTSCCSQLCLNPIILPVFYLILFLLTSNSTLQDICVPRATPWVCENLKKIKSKKKVIIIKSDV